MTAVQYDNISVRTLKGQYSQWLFEKQSRADTGKHSGFNPALCYLMPEIDGKHYLQLNICFNRVLFQFNDI